MHPEDTEKSLRQFLKSHGKTLKSLSAEEILHAATNFWLATTIDGVRPENGDGIVAYFELMNRGRGTSFEFGVNRIMVASPKDGEYSAWLPAFKLRISVGFKPILEVFQLPSVTSTFACWNKADVQGFIDEVRASPQFKLITSFAQHSSGISLEDCDAPWGGPTHPTRGLTWARA